VRSAVCRTSWRSKRATCAAPLGGILGEWGPLLLDLGDGTANGNLAAFRCRPR
jgi:hypothetical protein